jgi:hypothetical protein
MAKKQEIKATFTGREMEAIAAMLLSNKGINVDPIIKDIYPNLDDASMSMFRCKMALLLSGNLPEFKSFEGFHKDNSKKIFKYRCIGESSLMGTRQYEIVEIWRKQEDETWAQDIQDDFKEIGNIRNDSFEFGLYESIGEAEKNW